MCERVGLSGESDVLAKWRDDAGMVRAHRHDTYIQNGANGSFPVCSTCGPLSERDHTQERAQAMADAHHRNSGEVITGV